MNNLKPHPFFEFTDTLLPEEVAALEEYKIAPNGLAYQLNKLLREGRVTESPIPLLDSAIHKSRTIECIRLFRATFAEDFDPFTQDGVFFCPSYVSTTLAESRLGGHFLSGYSKRPIKLIIECPQGVNALHLELSGDSGETESECLLPRCGRYRIVCEHPAVTETKAMAQAMGQNNWYHAKDFEALRIIELAVLP